MLRNSCPYTIYPTFSSLQIERPTSLSKSSSHRRTDIKTRPHSSLTPRSPRRNPVPILVTPSCFTFFILIHSALPLVLRSAGLHLVPRMFSSLDSAAAPHSLCSTSSLFHFPFLHHTIHDLFLLLVQRCGSLP